MSHDFFIFLHFLTKLNMDALERDYQLQLSDTFQAIRILAELQFASLGRPNFEMLQSFWVLTRR